MADSVNPFFADLDNIENEIEVVRDYIDDDNEPQLQPEVNGITLDNVAAKLLRDNLLLAALELHTELVETGRELPRLRDFFSNPANFERAKGSDASPPGLRMYILDMTTINNF